MDKKGYQINTYKEWLVIYGEKYKPLCFVNFSPATIVNGFGIRSSWVNWIKKHVDLKQESKDLKKNGILIFGWLVECYSNDTNKLHTTYEIIKFTRALDWKVIRALVMILGLKIKIEVEASVIIMAYIIVQVHICYDFVAYLSYEMKGNLVHMDNGDFWYSYYLWWLIMDQHIQYFMGMGLKLTPPVMKDGITRIV